MKSTIHGRGEAKRDSGLEKCSEQKESKEEKIVRTETQMIPPEKWKSASTFSQGGENFAKRLSRLLSEEEMEM